MNKLFEIHHIDGSTLVSFETTSIKSCVEKAVCSGANLRYATLRGADLRGANLRRSDLMGATLRGSDLRYADLRGAGLSSAILRGANLMGAKIRNDIEIQKIPIFISSDKWHIYVFDEHIEIGCEFHSIEDWFAFDDRIINKMDRCALKWWRKNKEWIKGLCVAYGRYQPDTEPS